MTLKPSVFHGAVDVPLPDDPEKRAQLIGHCAKAWSYLLSTLEAVQLEAAAPKPNGAPVESKPPEPKKRRHLKRKRGRR